MVKRERIDETTIMRGISCLAVIMVHITANPVSMLNAGSPSSILFTLLNRGSKFTTPTFLFLSGLTLFYSYEARDFSYGKFLKRRFESTLIPYFIWSTVYFMYFYFKGIYILSPKFIAENFLLGKTSYHLYFVVTITQFYILFGGFLYIYRKYNSHLILGSTLIINVLFLKYGAPSMVYADRFFINYIFFFSLGCYVARNLSKVKGFIVKYKYGIVGGYMGMVVYDSYLFYQYYILQQPVSVFWVSVSWLVFSTVSIFALMYVGDTILNKGEKMQRIFKTISKSSYYVYLMHPLFLNISDTWLIEKGIYSITKRSLLNMFIVYTISLCLSIGYTNLKAYLKNTKNKTNQKAPIKQA